MAYLIIDNEAARLNALRDLRLLDTPPSESFDRLTRMASKLFNAPVSTVSLTDGDRQWFKSRVGVDLQEIPREQAPCSYAIQADEVFVVPDLLADDRFKTSPLAQAGIRFYAGAPLITRTGFGLGTICVVDAAPRTITADETHVLRDLAGMVMAQVEIQNMIGRVDATSGQANEHQLFEDLHDLSITNPDAERVGLLVEIVSDEQASHGLRVLGATYVEQVVRESVARLRPLIGNAARLYQVGPVRCLILWDDTLGRDKASMIATIEEALREPILCNGIPVAPEPAMGLHHFKVAAETGRYVLRCLFGALDDSRKKGTGHAVYSESHDKASARSFNILSDVARAMKADDQLFLVFQPRVDMATGRCVGGEALLRWRHPVLGALSPGEFIPLIEQTALVEPITQWVMQAAIRQVAEWQKRTPDLPRISINASAHNLEEPDFVENLRAQMERQGVSADAIELEFTESALADDGAKIIDRLTEIRRMGLDVAIDDFGAGYSNLSYLKNLPASVLKIDRSFITGLASEMRDRKLVRTMIDMAHDMGFRVVAEGIETPDTYELLRSWGCDEAQGYWIAKPMPAADFLDWTEARNALPGMKAA